MLSVSEVFYSIQGEGATIGRPAVFVRLSGCNLMCGGNGTQRDKQLHNGATWRCDTVEVWMNGTKKHYHEILGDEEVEAIRGGANLIITGGEPMLYQKEVSEFIQYVKLNINKDVFVEIETNGTKKIITELITQSPFFNCSPKLSNSGMSKDRRYKPEVIKQLNYLRGIFKFVVSTQDDVIEILEDYAPLIDKDKVWIMPSGENQHLLSLSKPACTEIVKKHKWKMTTRLHIDIWNQKTGV